MYKVCESQNTVKCIQIHYYYFCRDARFLIVYKLKNVICAAKFEIILD